MYIFVFEILRAMAHSKKCLFQDYIWLNYLGDIIKKVSLPGLLQHIHLPYILPDEQRIGLLAATGGCPRLGRDAEEPQRRFYHGKMVQFDFYLSRKNHHFLDTRNIDRTNLN